MYGWRARIGMVMAEVNTAMEPEFNRMAPDGVSMHGTRVAVGGVSVQDMTTPDAALVSAVKLLADLNPRVIAYSCNGSNITGGLEGEAAQARVISEATGRPAVMAATAVLEAIAALEVGKVSFGTLYPPDLNDSNTAFWKSCGVDVLHTAGVNMGGKRKPEPPYSSAATSLIGLQSPQLAYNLARSIYEQDKRAEAIVVIGGNVRTIEVAEAFETDFGIPFISTNLALFWASLQVAGVREPIKGYGRLLGEQPGLKWVRLKNTT